MVMVAEPAPGDAIDVGLKLTVTPVGCPLADKATAEPNPFSVLVVMVEVPLLPCTTETAPGAAEIVNVGDAAAATRALISPTPLGLPQPVTRS